MPKYTRSQVWERGFRKGEKAERERIIDILEANVCECGCDYVEFSVSYLIDIIKGARS